MNDDVFERREGDKVPGGVEGEEGVAAVGFELDPEGGEDEEGFCGWVRGAWGKGRRDSAHRGGLG